jgi:hypothetical protein
MEVAMTISKPFDEMSFNEQSVILYTVSDDRETLDKIMAATGPNNEYTIEITINGIKVDGERFSHRYAQEYGRAVEREAVRYANDKFEEMFEEIDQMRQDIHTHADSLREKYGIQRDSWGDY